ncbi:hypothetical protein [Streptococcus ruminantium]|uniref:PTS cellobiose transporter subunit IIA n=1 Tax=Streptococcus ruminantium TaxID=1917441 RepID=A0ABU1B4A0_9STRE|nr:hypothetical protein [Streptococcus ruminantium]MDQ8758587.1 hypothetical protein [Streptococcus ruminantium]MDQ8764268.1 hypothetical protein [Streptococcus ruminantium]MDQ8769347.1 hypothetical protein [Streptococcus ruminantium]MDQ8774137.1 hypothetical protein [Streptococcus ruminantium]MDQ8793167.1 hypothetical protein [Streptococcus ruminantium]
MRKKEYKKLEEYRQENVLKSMYYGRYFFIRYATVTLFFINLYWAISFIVSSMNLAVLLPAVLTCVALLGVWEQSRMFTTEQREASRTRLLYQIIIITNTFMLFLLLVNHYQYFYPFLANSEQVRVSLLVILLLGLGLAVAILQKLNKIRQGVDKQYYRIQQYLVNMKTK